MLTKKQRDLLEFIQKRLSKDGVPPSFDEMKDLLIEPDALTEFYSKRKILMDQLELMICREKSTKEEMRL